MLALLHHGQTGHMILLFGTPLPFFVIVRFVFFLSIDSLATTNFLLSAKRLLNHVWNFFVPLE